MLRNLSTMTASKWWKLDLNVNDGHHVNLPPYCFLLFAKCLSLDAAKTIPSYTKPIFPPCMIVVNTCWCQ